VSGSFDDQGRLDIGDGKIVSCFGKKRSGKSVMGRLYLATFPGDTMVIAANHDDGPFADPKGERGRPVHMIRGTAESIPRKWPEHLRQDKEPICLRIQVDPGSDTFLEDQDQAVALALRHPGTAILVHEIGLLAPANRVPPHTRRLLHANRHTRTTAIFCGPRTLTTDALVIGQSDVVHTFELAVPQDRKRIAENIGWSPLDFDWQVEQLGPHEYLRFDANESKPEEGQEDQRLIHFEALPVEVVRAIP
jgi:hypothetical protein